MLSRNIITSITVMRLEANHNVRSFVRVDSPSIFDILFVYKWRISKLTSFDKFAIFCKGHQTPVRKLGEIYLAQLGVHSNPIKHTHTHTHTHTYIHTHTHTHAHTRTHTLMSKLSRIMFYKKHTALTSWLSGS